jgi:hypothetical protein
LFLNTEAFGKEEEAGNKAKDILRALIHDIGH